MKKKGILMPVSAIPSMHGIGDFGPEAYHFIDLIKQAGFHIWQILPLNPLGYGNSPYQPYSSYAGDEIYISLEFLQQEHILSAMLHRTGKRESVDYKKIREYKKKYLWNAWKKFHTTEEYEEFTAQEWVYEYAVYITLKKKNQMKAWNTWRAEEKEWIQTKKLDLTSYQDEIQYEMFLQYIFYKQWHALKQYANHNGIQIMGDIPFCVGIDSVDVWKNQELFLLDAESKPSFVAGVPPDYFSKTGQRWGNPIYNWEVMKQEKYNFWIQRMCYATQLYDIVRIDHFRGFDTYWEIPGECSTAVDGEWKTAPGYEVFDCLLRRIDKNKIIVEDLGDLREEVHRLRDHYGFLGMQVLQFSIQPYREERESWRNKVVYTGTHDNTTLADWYEQQTSEDKVKIKEKMNRYGFQENNMVWNLISYLYSSDAEYAIVPMQDFLCLGKEARMNEPGTLGSPNWEWRMKSFDAFEKLIPKIMKVAYPQNKGYN